MQFAYLCVPEIDPSQYHPFTISKGEVGSGAKAEAGESGGGGAATWTHHIKAMGPGTWTQLLHEKVRHLRG